VTGVLAALVTRPIHGPRFCEQRSNLFPADLSSEPLGFHKFIGIICLDVSDYPACSGFATLIAQEIRQSIADELNLTASAGMGLHVTLSDRQLERQLRLSWELCGE
jgi:nucleotidyltransferase/DNA polymerase involved in DNA repair